MARIFISYSRADRQFVDQFIPLLRSVYGNDSVWFDDDIHGGADWWQTILDEIANCDIFIYLVSNESLESPYCQAELREALRLNKQILPIIVRRLNPSYPGNIDDDLAVILRKTQFIDMSTGFKDEGKNARIWGTINRLMVVASQPPMLPYDPLPTPEPPVRDKKDPDSDSSIKGVYIGGIFLLISVVIAGIFGLWQGVFANQPDDIHPTAIIQNNTEEPLITATLSGFDQLQTAQAELTQVGETLQALDLTATEIFISDSNATATAQLLEATETFAFATLFALSATPTPTATHTYTPSLTPTNTHTPPFTPNATATLIAFRPQTNDDWTPIEREFDGVPMVLVPAGCFMMGSDSGRDNEKPVHEQCVDAPFWIDQYEVTQAQFTRLGGVKANNNRFTGDNRPVENITWFEARDFCQLRGGRLPTEAEWEYAARGGDGLIYPWGNEWNANNAVWNLSREQGTTDVGSIPNGASWVGAQDMSGNVSEWTSSLYESYPYDMLDGRERDMGKSTDILRILRGGAYYGNDTDSLRAPDRSGSFPSYGFDFDGVRCVRQVD